MEIDKMTPLEIAAKIIELLDGSNLSQGSKIDIVQLIAALAPEARESMIMALYVAAKNDAFDN